LVANSNGDLMAASADNAVSGASYIYRPAGGDWTAPAAGPNPDGLSGGEHAEILMDAEGDVRWIEPFYHDLGSPRPDQIAYARWTPGTDVWSRLHLLSPIDDVVGTFDAAMNNDEDVVVGWSDEFDDQEGFRTVAIKSTFYPHTASSPRFVKSWVDQANCGSTALLGVGIDNSSNATVGWRQCSPANLSQTVVRTARREAADGAWSKPVTPFAQWADGTYPANGPDAVQVNPAGTTMLVLADSQRRLLALRRPPNGNYGNPQYLTPANSPRVGDRFVFTLGRDSDATVLYSHSRKDTRLFSRTYE
jgi:hypothetical protein